jgi:signal transduction histidine kinase
MTESDNTKNTRAETQRLEVLLDAARLLNSTLELKELTGIILEVVRAQVPVERVTVFVVDRAQKMLHSLVAQGIQDSEISLPLGSGIAGQVAANAEIIDVPDAYVDSRFERRFDGTLDYYTNDIFALPVFNRHGDVVGVLELLNRSRPISLGDREFLIGISVYIGLALENAWLHSQIVAKERLEEELAALRDRLAHMEQLSLMAQVFDAIVHEVNNPLTFARGYAELAMQEGEITPKVLAYLKKIESGIDRTATTVRKFQHFSEEPKGEFSRIDLGRTVRHVCELRSREWNLRGIHADINIGEAPQVLAREGQMQLVLLYLIRNAEEAILRSGAGGRIRIELSRSDQQAQIEIQDNGLGIAQEIQPLVFQPFFTTKSKGSGTGLGLAMAQSIVRQHQGQIRFASKEGDGTKFVVALPACAEITSAHG